MALARFGHHPDPATDFEVEVQDIEAEVYNYGVGFQPLPREVLLSRIDRAMSFRVGGVPSCVAAKDTLRALASSPAINTARKDSENGND